MNERGRVPIIWCPRYEVDIGKHVFPVEKYRLVKDRLEAGGWLQKARLESPEPATEEADLPPRVVPHPMLVPAPVEGREGRASSGTRATA